VLAQAFGAIVRGGGAALYGDPAGRPDRMARRFARALRLRGATGAAAPATITRRWTVDDLGREVGLSRSALADRFIRLIGVPPIHYPRQTGACRVATQEAPQHQRVPRNRVAAIVGYDSEAAFFPRVSRRRSVRRQPLGDVRTARPRGNVSNKPGRGQTFDRWFEPLTRRGRPSRPQLALRGLRLVSHPRK